MSQWTPLCRLVDVPEQGGGYVIKANHAFALFRCEGDPPVRVLDDTCPHAGASLSAGLVREGCVVCPMHAWPFDITTGACPDNPAVKVRAYPVRIADGVVMIQLPTP